MFVVNAVGGSWGIERVPRSLVGDLEFAESQSDGDLAADDAFVFQGGWLPEPGILRVGKDGFSGPWQLIARGGYEPTSSRSTATRCTSLTRIGES